MIGHTSGAAYLVSVGWLGTALAALHAAREGQGTGSLARGSLGTDVSGLGAGPGPLARANVIPVFPTLSVTSSVASGHPLSAFAVVHDPTHGHIALFQTSSPPGAAAATSISSVNLTVLLASIDQEQRLTVWCHCYFLL
jgi:hypothetical protein